MRTASASASNPETLLNPSSAAERERIPEPQPASTTRMSPAAAGPPERPASNSTSLWMHSRVVSWLPVPNAIPGSSQSTECPAGRRNALRSHAGTQWSLPNVKALKCSR